MDFSTPLADVFGKPMTKVDENEKSAPLTLRCVATQALMTPHKSDEKLSGQDKFNLHDLTRRIVHEPDTHFTSGELDSIKDRIGLMFPQAVIGATYPLLDKMEE